MPTSVTHNKHGQRTTRKHARKLYQRWRVARFVGMLRLLLVIVAQQVISLYQQVARLRPQLMLQFIFQRIVAQRAQEKLTYNQYRQSVLERQRQAGRQEPSLNRMNERAVARAPAAQSFVQEYGKERARAPELALAQVKKTEQVQKQEQNPSPKQQLAVPLQPKKVELIPHISPTAPALKVEPPALPQAKKPDSLSQSVPAPRSEPDAALRHERAGRTLSRTFLQTSTQRIEVRSQQDQPVARKVEAPRPDIVQKVPERDQARVLDARRMEAEQARLRAQVEAQDRTMARTQEARRQESTKPAEVVAKDTVRVPETRRLEKEQARLKGQFDASDKAVARQDARTPDVRKDSVQPVKTPEIKTGERAIVDQGRALEARRMEAEQARLKSQVDSPDKLAVRGAEARGQEPRRDGAPPQPVKTPEIKTGERTQDPARTLEARRAEHAAALEQARGAQVSKDINGKIDPKIAGAGDLSGRKAEPLAAAGGASALAARKAESLADARKADDLSGRKVVAQADVGGAGTLSGRKADQLVDTRRADDPSLRKGEPPADARRADDPSVRKGEIIVNAAGGASALPARKAEPLVDGRRTGDPSVHKAELASAGGPNALSVHKPEHMADAVNAGDVVARKTLPLAAGGANALPARKLEQVADAGNTGNAAARKVAPPVAGGASALPVRTTEQRADVENVADTAARKAELLANAGSINTLAGLKPGQLANAGSAGDTDTRKAELNKTGAAATLPTSKVAQLPGADAASAFAVNTAERYSGVGSAGTRSELKAEHLADAAKPSVTVTPTAEGGKKLPLDAKAHETIKTAADEVKSKLGGMVTASAAINYAPSPGPAKPIFNDPSRNIG